MFKFDKKAYCALFALWVFSAFPMRGNADTIVFEGASGTTTTGELLEGISIAWTTNIVQEFTGLEIRARTIDATQSLNANNGYFGINSDLAGENLQAFDVGEGMVLSFNRNIRIDRFDFNLFDAGESFTVSVAGSDPLGIAFENLSNQSSDYFNVDGGLWVAADTEIEFRATNGSIGLDGIDVTIDAVPEPAILGLLGLSGFGLLVGRRLFHRT